MGWTRYCSKRCKGTKLASLHFTTYILLFQMPVSRIAYVSTSACEISDLSSLTDYKFMWIIYLIHYFEVLDCILKHCLH